MIVSKMRESSTFMLVVIHLLIVDYMWITGAINASLVEFTTGIGTLLGIWLGREWRKAHYK